MRTHAELSAGSKVAVVGEGVAAAAFALALAQAGRRRSRAFDVTVFTRCQAPSLLGAPAVITPEVRALLAGLGCRLPPELRSGELKALEVSAGGRAELIPFSSGSVWLVDGWPSEPGGARLAQELREAGAAVGVRSVDRTVDSIDPAMQQPRPGSYWAARSGGATLGFDFVAFASGGPAPAGEAFSGIRRAPTLPAFAARLVCPSPRVGDAQLVRLAICPHPEVDLLLCVPGAGSLFALAVGRTAEAADVCEALMNASRDGLVPQRFEIASLERTSVPAGYGSGLCGERRLVLGQAACGHPLELSASDAVPASLTAANAVVERGVGTAELSAGWARGGLRDQADRARAATCALGWLRRAAERAPAAFARARARERRSPGPAGVLGLSAPSPFSLLASARWAGAVGWMRRWFLGGALPAARALPPAEPHLYYVVDDDPALRDALTEYLASAGAQVVCFSDELALFSAVARRRPTAVLLDVVLQWVDGLRLCEGLKRHPSTRDARVIVMSALDRPHVRQQAQRAGAEAFLAKPFVFAELWRVLVGESTPRSTPFPLVESGRCAS